MRERFKDIYKREAKDFNEHIKKFRETILKGSLGESTLCSDYRIHFDAINSRISYILESEISGKTIIEEAGSYLTLVRFFQIISEEWLNYVTQVVEKENIDMSYFDDYKTVQYWEFELFLHIRWIPFDPNDLREVFRKQLGEEKSKEIDLDYER